MKVRFNDNVGGTSMHGLFRMINILATTPPTSYDHGIVAMLAAAALDQVRHGQESQVAAA